MACAMAVHGCTDLLWIVSEPPPVLKQAEEDEAAAQDESVEIVASIQNETPGQGLCSEVNGIILQGEFTLIQLISLAICFHRSTFVPTVRLFDLGLCLIGMHPFEG